MTANGTAGDCIVRLRGLPWSAKEQDIRNFLDDCQSYISSIHLTLNDSGRASGEAYVEFTHPEGVEIALKHDNEHIGSRYIEVFPAKRSEMSWDLSHNANISEDAIIRMRGVPYRITKDEISQFFAGYSVVPNGILIPVDSMGRSTGEAFVQFTDSDTAEKAMIKDKEQIGHRYVELFRSSQDEVKRTVWRLSSGVPASAPGSYSGGNMTGGGFGMRGGYGGGMGRARASPYAMSASGYGGSGNFGGTRMGGYGGMPGMAPMGAGMMNMGMSGYGGMSTTTRAASAAGGSLGAFGNRNMGGHYVHMRGLPYRATEKDIREFFSPLQIANVNITFDGTGRPSGEADVEFFSHMDAVEAMKKDRDSIGSRYVELFLNSSAADVKPLIGGGIGLNPMGLMGGGGGFGDFTRDSY